MQCLTLPSFQAPPIRSSPFSPAIVAQPEIHSGILGLHFVDLKARGAFKVILAPGADIHGLTEVMRHYARMLRRQGQTQRPARSGGAILAAERAAFQKAWASFDPALGGDQLPGGNGITWRDALRLTGRERALFLSTVGLIKAILGAYRYQLCLRVTSWPDGIRQETLIIPRRLERCPRCLHVFDGKTELRFFLDADLEIWAGIHREERVPVVHVFSAQGNRRAVIEFAGDEDERESWNQAISSAAGLSAYE